MKNLTILVNYKNGLDFIPHEWLLGVLNLYRVDPNIIYFLEHLMSNW